VGNIADIRGLKIVSEQGIASGVRRIEAVAGSAFIEYVNARDAVVKQLSATLKLWISNVLHSEVAVTSYFRLIFFCHSSFDGSAQVLVFLQKCQCISYETFDYLHVIVYNSLPINNSVSPHFGHRPFPFLGCIFRFLLNIFWGGITHSCTHSINVELLLPKLRFWSLPCQAKSFFSASSVAKKRLILRFLLAFYCPKLITWKLTPISAVACL